MELAFWIVLAVLVVVAVAGLADKLNASAPLLLVIVGIVVSYLPLVPQYELQPELVLVGILPPLLFSAAYKTSFIDFRAKKGTIASLSVGLVIFTTLLVGFLTYLLVPGVPLAAGFALGAIVAPPDAVAATAVARRVGMPDGIVQVLEGESLVNDATALTALRSAVIAIAGSVTVIQIGLSFVLAAGGGVVIGLVFAYVFSLIRRGITNPAYDTALTFTVPYLAYVCAEEIESSGVIAVVVAGLVIGHKAPRIQSGRARLTNESNWATLSFLLEHIVFLLIGLQLPGILAGLARDDVTWVTVVVGCVGVYFLTVISRFVWVYGAAILADVRWFGQRATKPNWPELTVISWAGMRGVVTLAAALALPTDLLNREFLILIAFVVVLASLLIQGTTLKPLVRKLDLHPPDPGERALQEASLMDRMTRASRERLADIASLDNSEIKTVVERIQLRAEDRRNAAWERATTQHGRETPVEIYTRLRMEMLAAEREVALEARDEGGYDDQVIREVIQYLDVEEAILDVPVTGGSRQTELVPGERLASACDHLASAQDQAIPADPGCQECLALGQHWIRLRMCLTCGHVGCCDSTPGQHSTAHYEETGHPVMRSIETGEAWRWCYVDNILG